MTNGIGNISEAVRPASTPFPAPAHQANTHLAMAAVVAITAIVFRLSLFATPISSMKCMAEDYFGNANFTPDSLHKLNVQTSSYKRPLEAGVAGPCRSRAKGKSAARESSRESQ